MWTTVTSTPRAAMPAAASKEASADDDNFVAVAERHHFFSVFEISVGDDAFQIMTGKWDHEWVGACAEDQLVIGQHIAVCCRHGARFAVYRRYALAEAAGDALAVVPSLIVGDDLFIGFVPREDGREHDAVIVPARLCVEEGDVIGVRSRVGELFQHPTRGHARAYYDEFFSH